MRAVVLLVVALMAVAFAGCVSGPGPEPVPESGTAVVAADDAVVIAVVDSGFNPYHWDFVDAKMPQHLNDDPTDDLPLQDDPAAWLPLHPGAGAFASYQPLSLSVNPHDATLLAADLATKDSTEWAKVQRSDGEQVHMTWIPGTKIVGYVNFGSGNGFAPGSHGVGTSSVSVGNLYGACPECLLVYVNGASEMANEWVAKQDWIDLQTNSWGLSLLMRDRLYAGSDLDIQRRAIERGHQIFFSAGNGQTNTFTVPNPTLWSSQEGPDWIITVGAVTPTDGASYSGHGKPADISSIGSGYDSAGGGNLTASREFGGTSNATPVTAGVYGRALYLLRREMADASRVQNNGTIAQGSATCQAANADCALADGVLTVDELRTAFFQAAAHTPAGWSPSLTGVTVPYETDEMRFLAEGHGTYWGRLNPHGSFEEESARIAAFANGTWFEEQDPEERDWFIADSFCRQSLWGAWDSGYFHEGSTLPASDWVQRPLRTWFLEECPTRGKLIHDIVSTVNGS